MFSELHFPSSKLRPCWIALATLSLFLSQTYPSRAQDGVSAKTGNAIVSPSHPKDSRGEIVYEMQGKSQKDQEQPLIPGVLTHPIAVKVPSPKYPKSMKKAKSTADVAILCTVTAAGEVIDESVESSSDADASASAFAAVQKYKFKPATLDGKPVASLLRVVVMFRVK